MDPGDANQPRTRTMLVPLLTVAAVAVALAYVQALQGLLATLAFSALAAILSRAFQRWLLGRGLGRGLALTLTVAAFILILVLLGAAAVAAMLAIAVQLSGDTETLRAQLAAASDAFAAATGLPTGSVPSVDADAIIAGARQLLSTVGPAVTSLFMAVLIVTYLLLDADNLRARMIRHTPAGSVARYDALANELVVYIKVRAMLGAGAAVADSVFLLVLGVPYAVLWGVLSFLFSFVPNIGFILALIPPTVFALLELGLGPAVLVVVGYVAINLAFDYILQPRIMATDLDMSPVVVIVSILVWTAFIGPVGALLAVPLTLALRVVLVPFEGARWFVALLGPVPGEAGGDESLDPSPDPSPDPTIAAVPDPVAADLRS